MDVAVYVPAHGFVDDPAVLREEERNYRLAIERIVAEGRRLHDARVPVENAAGELLGVFDVDSTAFAAFDATDAHWLEKILRDSFSR